VTQDAKGRTKCPDTFLPGLSQSRPIDNDAAVLAEITDVVRQVLEDRAIEVHRDTAIDDLAGWDSMNHIAILVETECRFDVTFELQDIDATPTVGHLVRLVQAKRSAVGRGNTQFSPSH
jgi:acyl carrier protein